MIDWTAELEASICEKITEGETIRAICKSPGFPSAPALYRHIVDSPSFREQYARAKEAQMEAMAEEIIDIADRADSEGHNVARLQVDTRKWLMSKLAARRYGDKVQVGGDPGNPIQAEITVNFVKSNAGNQS